MYHYYVAAVRNESGKRALALESLEKALEAGFRDFPGLESSPYFATLVGTPEYKAPVQASAAEAPNCLLANVPGRLPLASGGRSRTAL